MAHPPSYDLRYLEAALEVLEDFLKSTEMYWNLNVSPPAGSPPYPQLSLGNVLLALQCLERPLEGPDQEARREDLRQRLHRIQHQYRSLWDQKARREAQMRVRLWAQYVDELAREEAARAYYPTEVRNRVIFELLARRSALLPALGQLCTHSDRRLQHRFRPGAFVWDADLEPAFPREPFWYLYGRPA